MKKRVLLLTYIVFSVLLSGCGSQNTANNDPNTLNKSNKEKGVYYKPISKSVLKSYSNDNGSDDQTEYLSWKNAIYTNTVQIDYSKITNILGKKLTDLYGYDYVVWSDKKKDLNTTNCSATLYYVNGFDPSYLVAIKRGTPADDTVEVINLYECVNDLTVNKGSDLYRKYLRLEEACQVKGEIYNLEGESLYSEKVLSKKDYLTFLQEIMELSFLENKETMEEECKKGASCYMKLSFEYDSGVLLKLFLYDNGFISYGTGDTAFYQKLGAKQTQNIMQSIKSLSR